MVAHVAEVLLIRLMNPWEWRIAAFVLLDGLVQSANTNTKSAARESISAYMAPNASS